MKQVIIVDDEPLAILLVQEYLNKHEGFEVIATCLNGFDAYKAIQEHGPDLVFLDVQMPKISGFELLEMLEQPPAIIFTTAFDQYAVQAFEQQAIDYLLKPFSAERFDQAIANFLQRETNFTPIQMRGEDELKRIVVKAGSSIRIINLNDVICFEAYDDYVKIHTANDVFLKKQTLSALETVLPANQYVRVHRSFIISLAHLEKIEQLNKDSHQAVMQNGLIVATSRNGFSLLKQVLTIGF